jgi:hypothetical protein
LGGLSECFWERQIVCSELLVDLESRQGDWKVWFSRVTGDQAIVCHCETAYPFCCELFNDRPCAVKGLQKKMEGICLQILPPEDHQV